MLRVGVDAVVGDVEEVIAIVAAVVLLAAAIL